LLVAITEGGETSFVIGTVETAAEISSRTPYFLYCNPDEVLINLVERSRRVIRNDSIRKINLTTGQQVLSGSTRMQASTIQQLAAGRALFLAAEGTPTPEAVRESASRLTRFYRALELSPVARFTVKEAELYERGEYVIYETDDYPLAVATDTTERAPTFSLTPFENVDDPEPPHSWAYIAIPGAADSAGAWHHLFGREPRALEWPEVRAKAGRERLLGFDISRDIYDYRARTLGREKLHTFRIYRDGHEQVWELEELEWRMETGSLDLLDEFTVLKMLLNTHSTLIMGRVGRYESNIMLYVRPSNFKLIDRTARYVQHLLRRDGVERSYEEVVHEIFRQLEQLREDESVVWHTYLALRET
jgi:N-acetylmuramic acid 6-phosphate etherase